MKKQMLITLLLIFALIFTLCACSNPDDSVTTAKSTMSAGDSSAQEPQSSTPGTPDSTDDTATSSTPVTSADTTGQQPVSSSDTTGKQPVTSQPEATQTTEPVATSQPENTEPTVPVTTSPLLVDITDANGLMWYQFEEASGATVLKSSLGNPRDSIQISGVLDKTAGINSSGAFIFDGETSFIKLNNAFTDWSQINSGTFLHPATQAESVSLWFMPTELGEQRILFEQGSQYRGFAIGIDDNILKCAIVASTDSNADGTQNIIGDFEITDNMLNTWINVIFTFDGMNVGGTACMYVNNVLIAEENNVGSWIPQVLDASAVGTSTIGTNAFQWADGNYFKGRIDDLRIYSTSLMEIPELEDDVSYLQSASAKNYYIKGTKSSVTYNYMVEPALRGIIFEKGLADENGVSLRMSGTNTYISVDTNGNIVLIAPKTDDEKKAATFYKETALSIPTWGETDANLFCSFRAYGTTDKYIYAADNGTITLSTATTTAAKLAATFKITGDQTATIENLRGAVYYPTYALNAPQFWKWYDSEIIERDMQYAKELNITAFRIWISYEYWLEDPDHFEAAFRDFLSLADEYDIKIMVSLFEGCGLENEGYYSANTFSRDYSKAWSITSPCKEVYNNSSRWNEPAAFVTWFMGEFKDDNRLMAIEPYNEPWGTREACAKYLSELVVSLQGSVPVTFGTAPAGSYNIVYSISAGADMIHYHDNFPSSTTNFYNNALGKIAQGRLANLPVYCTEVQWVGGPAGINYPVYSNLAPTCETLMETEVWAPFYWTLMVHPCYLDSYRNNYKMKNGLIREDGSYYNIANAQAIAPEADLSDAVQNSHNPFDDKSYTYQYNFSDTFFDLNAYKWTSSNGTWSAASGAYVGSGLTLSNSTDFRNLTATFEVTTASEAGFVFRVTNATNYYYASVTDDTITLYKVVNGTKTQLASKAITASGKLTVTVGANGTSLSVKCGTVECTATDSTYTKGSFGFTATESSTFDNLSVSSIR